MRHLNRFFGLLFILGICRKGCSQTGYPTTGVFQKIIQSSGDSLGDAKWYTTWSDSLFEYRYSEVFNDVMRKTCIGTGRTPLAEYVNPATLDYYMGSRLFLVTELARTKSNNDQATIYLVLEPLNTYDALYKENNLIVPIMRCTTRGGSNSMPQIDWFLVTAFFDKRGELQIVR